MNLYSFTYFSLAFPFYFIILFFSMMLKNLVLLVAVANTKCRPALVGRTASSWSSWSNTDQRWHRWSTRRQIWVTRNNGSERSALMTQNTNANPSFSPTSLVIVRRKSGFIKTTSILENGMHFHPITAQFCPFASTFHIKSTSPSRLSLSSGPSSRL